MAWYVMAIHQIQCSRDPDSKEKSAKGFLTNRRRRTCHIEDVSIGGFTDGL